MNETTKTEQTLNLSMNEKKMKLLIYEYLCHVLKELPVVKFYDEQFLALIDILLHDGKVGAIKYLRSLFPDLDKQWNHTGSINNEFEKFIKTDYPHIKPQQNRVSELGLREAKDIVDWIEANRQYTQYLTERKETRNEHISR